MNTVFAVLTLLIAFSYPHVMHLDPSHSLVLEHTADGRGYELVIRNNTGTHGPRLYVASMKVPSVRLINARNGMKYVYVEAYDQATEVTIYKVKGNELKEAWSESTKQGVTAHFHGSDITIALGRFSFQVEEGSPESAEYFREVYRFSNGTVNRVGAWPIRSPGEFAVGNHRRLVLQRRSQPNDFQLSVRDQSHIGGASLKFESSSTPLVRLLHAQGKEQYIYVETYGVHAQAAILKLRSTTLAVLWKIVPADVIATTFGTGDHVTIRIRREAKANSSAPRIPIVWYDVYEFRGGTVSLVRASTSSGN